MLVTRKDDSAFLFQQELICVVHAPGDKPYQFQDKTSSTMEAWRAVLIPTDAILNLSINADAS
jgi:hypothetical protein